MKQMLVIFVPPLYLLTRGKVGAFLINLVFYLLALGTFLMMGIGIFFWFCCVVHAQWHLRQEIAETSIERVTERMAEKMIAANRVAARLDGLQDTKLKREVPQVAIFMPQAPGTPLSAYPSPPNLLRLAESPGSAQPHSAALFCGECGNKAEPGSKFCAECGASLS